jgi:hypothetical protein
MASLRLSLPSKSLSTPSVFHLKAARNHASVSVFDGNPSRAPLANPLRYGTVFPTSNLNSIKKYKEFSVTLSAFWIILTSSVLFLQYILVCHGIIFCLMILLVFLIIKIARIALPMKERKREMVVRASASVSARTLQWVSAVSTG